MSNGLMELAVKLGSTAGASALGMPKAAPAIEPLLRELLQVQDEQAAAIARIDARVDRLIQGPWGTARSYLAEAALPNIPRARRIAKLEEACRELQRAIPLQEEDTLPRAYANLELSLIQRLLDDIPSSELTAQKALQNATAFILHEMKLLNERDEAREGLLQAANPLYLIPLLPFTAPLAAKSARNFARTRSHRPRNFPALYQEYAAIAGAARSLLGEDHHAVRDAGREIEEFRWNDYKGTAMMSRLKALPSSGGKAAGTK